MGTAQRADQTGGNEPRPGDILVTREAHSPVVFTIREVPGLVQLQAKSRDQALDTAREFAREQQVDVWYDDGDELSVIERFRANEPV